MPDERIERTMDAGGLSKTLTRRFHTIPKSSDAARRQLDHARDCRRKAACCKSRRIDGLYSMAENARHSREELVILIAGESPDIPRFQLSTLTWADTAPSRLVEARRS